MVLVSLTSEKSSETAHTQVSHTIPGSVRHCHAQCSVWKRKTDYDLKMDELVLRGVFTLYASLLTQLLCPFDGGPCVGCISLCQVHHLWADLPPHKRIQTCKKRSEVMISLNGWIWMYVWTLYLLQMYVVCSQCLCPWRCLFPWWSSHHQHQSSTLQTWLPVGLPSKAHGQRR